MDLLEKLILEVQNYPLLYNKALKDYKNLIKKADAWLIIASNLEQSGQFNEKFIFNQIIKFYFQKNTAKPNGKA